MSCKVQATAMESCRKRLQQESTCSVCLEYFTDPVTLDCGHNFCRSCITKCWEESSRDAACAQCREKVDAKRLKPNKQLASMVKITKEMNYLLKHCALSVDEAAEECKALISGSLEILKQGRENIVMIKTQSKTESQELLRQMKEGRVKTRAAFRQMHKCLKDQEKLLLSQVEEVEKEIARRRDEHLARLSRELSSLESLIPELEERKLQSAGDLLENFGNILERCPKEPLKYPAAFPMALNWKVRDFCHASPFLNGIMRQFQDNLISGFPLYKERVTLDPGTAHPQLILSEDRKSVKKGRRRQTLPKNPERFDCLTFVLGREKFSSGTHFWEVTVGSEEEWAVGVARASVRRKGFFDVCPKEGIWDLGKWEGNYRVSKPIAFSSPDYSCLPLSQKLKTVRVTLDCAGGRVAFFNADTGELLYAYTDASLSRETLVPFFYIEAGGQLTICS